MSRLVIDTNVLWDVRAMTLLRARPEPRILPAVALAERARQYAKRGVPLADLWRLLGDARIEIEALDEVAALRRAVGILDDRAWDRLARDAFIGGHVREGDLLWTRNVADFLAVGVPRDQIVDTAGL